MELALCRTVLAVVPTGRIPALIKRGYKSTARWNGWTATLYKRFPSAEEAILEARRADFICSVVPCVS